ncbi:toll-like receptor Tollo [Anopheles moucheti]|uniref:toll-like receptor Tollo n=1 Tax=Anopheles moucheti TaxID=186751 RepID=UPI0022F07D09|nr:toll-like receptor Tollo [Anopheles moucheti]
MGILKFVFVLLYLVFATVAENDEQQEFTTQNAEDGEMWQFIHEIGILEGTKLTIGESSFDSSDWNTFEVFPNLSILTVRKQGRSLQTNIFEWAKTLDQVYMDDNLLTAVPKESLSALTSLRILSISNNRLEALGDGDEFLGLDHMEQLYLDRNSINVVHPHTFASLRKLKQLALTANRLTSLDGLMLPPENQLERLSVGHNYVKSFNESIFVRMSALRELSLDGNLLETLRDNTFAELRELRRLDLSDNFFKTFSSKLFASNRKLVELVLARNLIENLPVDVFRGLNNLTDLSLQGNRLTHLPEQIFRDQPQFTRLSLEGNRIENFGPIFLKCTDVELQNNRVQGLSKISFDTNATLVERLSLHGNEIATIEQSVFEGLPKLENIYLDYNRITELSPMLFHTNHELQQVTLSYNRLSVLRTNTFSGLARLHQVDLSYNQLSAIEPAAFHHSPVEYLYLNGNQLTTLDGWTFSGTNLLHLFLDSNAIESLLTSSGTVLDGLMEISASNNHIASWEAFCTSNITHLTFINLSNNSLTSLEGDCLDHLLPRVNDSAGGRFGSDTLPVQLNVAYNMLSEVPVLAGHIQSLDLSGNNVSDLGDGSAFQWYQQTGTLTLQNTTLRMVRSQSFRFLQNLTQLLIGSSVLELIEEDAFHALKLQALLISNSSLATFPPLLLRGQIDLYVVSLAFNALSHLSSSFFADCAMLEEINLSHNRITTVDQLWFQNLPQLKIITLDNNLIAQLPPQIVPTNHILRTLSLAGNALSSISNADFLANVSIYELNLSDNKLEDIDILQSNDIINRLDVSQNRLRRLLVRPNYRTLVANSNNISALRLEPDSQFELVYLNLADNQLDQLDPQLFDVRTLNELNVSENRLNAFPFELVYKLKQLKNLIVSRNNIRTLPPTDTVELFKLQTLDLSENPLEEQGNTFLDACVVNNLIVTVAK